MGDILSKIGNNNLKKKLKTYNYYTLSEANLFFLIIIKHEFDKECS